MIKLTKTQQVMVDAGYPASLFMTLEERKKAWDDSPPRPMPSFGVASKTQDPAALALMAELEEQKKTKGKNRIAKMLAKKEDRTGQRWDGRRGKWIDENELTNGKTQAMFSITTNTRGSTKMAKDYAEMTGPELVEAYNKKSGKPPIKKFKDKATGLAAMAKLTTEAKATATVKSVAVATADKLPKAAKAPKEGSSNKRAAEFGARVGSFREKLIIALDENFKKMIPELDLLKAVYGSKNTENAGALTMVLKGAQIMIDKNKLPYILKKEKNEAKEISHGLYPKA